jgi:hypothetical protein
MGWIDRLEENATRLGESARKAAASAPGQIAGEGLRGIRAMFRDDDGQQLSVERFLLVLIQAVRDDERREGQGARDLYVSARKRRRRLGLMSFGAGPLVGVANQLADLYCETATFCDVAAHKGWNLSDEQVGAHMLVLWGVSDDHEAARRAMAGEPPVAEILASRLREQAAGQLPDTLTKRSITKALWDVRGAIGDARKGTTTDAVKTVAFTGHRTKKLIKQVEAQLETGARDGRIEGGETVDIDLTSPEISATLERAGMLPPSSRAVAQLEAAWATAGGGDESLLEISRAQWGNETEGPEDVLVVLLRKTVVLVSMQKKGFLGAPQPSPRPLALADYQDVGEDDEIFGHSVVFLAPDEDDHFLLSWRDAAERQRMFMAIFDAHRGRFGRWGVQLDPDSYGSDFERFHAQLVAEGPNAGSAMDVFNWAEQRFGEFDISNALGLAADWRGCELDDAAGREPSRRISRLGVPEPWISSGVEAQRVFLRLGEQLFDAGLLNAPYDERTFDTGEPITASDAGPARLIALMNLAMLAKRFGHPRAQTWIDNAKEGIPLVPPETFSKDLRERWSEVGDLPPVDEGPEAEIPIHEDVDVSAISSREGDRITYSQDGLTEEDDELIKAFFMADQELGEDGHDDGEAVIAVCLIGVKAFEDLSVEAPAGWRKLILYAISDLTYDLWKKHRMGDPAAKLAHWVVATIEANGWGPDGRSTPLGQHHSYAMGVAVDSGIGAIVFDPDTGEAKAPTGDEARRAAVVGHF